MPRRVSPEEFNTRRKEIHGDKYELLTQFINTNTIVRFNCSDHGEFNQRPYKHLQGQGCPKCRYIKMSNTRTNLSIEEIFNIAAKYKTKQEFRLKEKQAYNSARKRKILPQIGKHLETFGTLHKRCIYAYEFSKHVYVGLTYNIEKRDTGRKANNKDAVTKYINETGETYKLKQLSGYINAQEASKLEGHYVEEYKKLGFTILNRSKTGALGACPRKWNKESISKEALKYNSRTEFLNKAAGCYGAAKDLGIFEEVTSHMSNKKLNGKCVLQYDVNGNLIQEFISIYEANRVTSVSIYTIQNCLSKKRPPRIKLKYIWKLKDPDPGSLFGLNTFLSSKAMDTKTKIASDIVNQEPNPDSAEQAADVLQSPRP